MVDHLPGTITFLFTDVEGSTELLQQLGSGNYGRLLSDHHAILRNAFADHRGTEIDTQGDAFFASFPRASNAVLAVVQIQQALANHSWPEGAQVRVRMGLHTGEPWLIEEGYVGMDVHRAARVGHCGHGGQVLLSETTTSLVRNDLPDGIRLRDLGRHQLKDLRRPEPIHQLDIPGFPNEFPPLKSLKAYPPHSPSVEAEQIAREPRDTGPNPYRGLASFRESDAEFFFGREAFTNDLHQIISQKPVTAVIVGSSGAGKSSVVAAGLLPRLRNEPGWLLLRFRPGSQPFQALATALIPSLEPDLDELDRLSAIQKMAAALLNREVSLALINDRLLQKHGQVQRILLIADQFEELYTLCPDPELRQAFLDELLSATQSGSGKPQSYLCLLLTLRADFMGQALAYRPFADTLKDNTHLLGPMSRDELQAAIEKPAEKQGAAFETGLVSRILDDIGQEPGNLPLLEFALTLLWEAMDQGWMTHKAYEAIGRVDGALSRHADSILASLQEKEQGQARRIFIQLVQPGTGTDDTRRVARRQELTGVDWTLVQHLADERLVVTGRDESGDETVEVVHEALIRGWGQLRRWMAADREFRNWQEGLRAALLGWERTSYDEGALLRGVPLAQAEGWLLEREEEIGEAEKSFIEASATVRDRRRAVRERRRRSIIAGLAVGLVIAIVLTIFAFNQRGIAEKNAVLAQQNAAVAKENAAAAEAEAQARATQQAIAEEQALIANARSLSGVSLEELTTDPQRGLLIALHAAELAHSVDGTLLPEPWTALHEAVRQVSRLKLSIPAQDDRLPYIVFSPNSNYLVAHYISARENPATFPDDTVTKIWDVTTGEMLHELPVGIVVAQWPQGEQVAIADIKDNDSFNITIWDVSSGLKMNEHILDYPSDPVYSSITGVALNTNLSMLAISWEIARDIGLWDLRTGTLEFIEAVTGGPTYIQANLPSYLVFSRENGNLVSVRPPIELFSTNSLFEARDKLSGELLYTFGLYLPEVREIRGSFKFISLSNSGNLMSWPLDGYSLIKNSTTGEDLVVLSDPVGFVTAMNFGREDRLFAAAAQNNIIYLWDLDTSIATQNSQLILTIASPNKPVHDLAISQDGSLLATASSDGSIDIWDIRTGGEAEIAPLGYHIKPSANRKNIVTLSPDGRRLALSIQGLAPTIWDVTTQKPLFSLEGDTGAIEDITFSPDGSIIATCSYAGPLIIWNGFDGQELGSLDNYNEGACTLDFHPLGKSMALGFYKNQSGWYQVIELPDLPEVDRSSNFLQLPFPWRGFFSGELSQLEFNNQGNHLAGITNLGELIVWDPWLENSTAIVQDTGGVVEDLSVLLNDDVYYQSVAFSTDATRMVTGGVNGTVALWDAQSFETLFEIPSHKGQVDAVVFSPDGSAVATGSANGNIKIWDSDSGQNIMSLPNIENGVTDLVFSPDGKRLYAAAGDGTVHVFLMDVDELTALARSKVTRSLTQQECQVYLNLDQCP